MPIGRIEKIDFTIYPAIAVTAPARISVRLRPRPTVPAMAAAPRRGNGRPVGAPQDKIGPRPGIVLGRLAGFSAVLLAGPAETGDHAWISTARGKT